MFGPGDTVAGRHICGKRSVWAGRHSGGKRSVWAGRHSGATGPGDTVAVKFGRGNGSVDWLGVRFSGVIRPGIVTCKPKSKVCPRISVVRVKSSSYVLKCSPDQIGKSVLRKAVKCFRDMYYVATFFMW